MIRASRLATPLLALAGAAMGLAGCSSVASLPVRADVLNLGLNSTDEPCTATRSWNDPATPDTFATTYFITCRGASASRPVGAVRVVEEGPRGLDPLEKQFDCGAATAVPTQAGAADARRCFDKVLGIAVVRLDRKAGNRRIVADGAVPLLGPVEEAMAVVAGVHAPSRNADKKVASVVNPDALPAAPSAQADAAAPGSAAFDPSVALAQGVSLNRRGLNVEASRVLNDALSRLPADASPAVRAELLLEAGLADSNISFADSAKDHFDRANALITSDPAAATPFLQRKRDAYRALDLINRRQFRQSLAALEQLMSGKVSADQPLMDPAIVREVNQVRRDPKDASGAVSVPDTTDLQQVVLDTTANWARSVALLALGETDNSQGALDSAMKSYRALQGEPVDQNQLLWLGARLMRQQGRLAAARKDWPTALKSFDGALDNLRKSALATAGTGTEPAIAEAQLEQASIIAQSGADADTVRNAYAGAVDAMIAANQVGSALPVGIESYFDLLADEASKAPRADTYERFFRAMQAAGETAVARQLSQLQTVVNSDPALAAKVRERGDLEREITRLRYAISTGGADAPELERQRQAADDKLLQVIAELGRNDRYRSVDDQPASVAEVRAALRPGEGMLKVTQLDRRAYGLYIDANQIFIYKIAGNQKALQDYEKLAEAVRASIDGQLDEGKLVAFDTPRAYVLFRLVAGPAADAIRKAGALVFDPAGPLQRLPAGVLVTDYDAKNPPPAFDYSKVAFLAAKTTVSTAVSPRSFLVARSLPSSQARQAFLGLGEHQPPEGAVRKANINVGFGCSVPYDELAKLSREFVPISKAELIAAATALGVPRAPMITDAAFSDSEITKLGTSNGLADYQVLHFATHGLEEGQWGCAKSPPALVTSFGDADSDGLLSFSEIAALNLDANLVVLSACETASGVTESLARESGQEEKGSTLEGLVRAFLTAHARAVLATLWQVSAESESEEFIRTFYRTARTDSIGGSLQAAQRELIVQPKFSHPFYWAPYFVVGDSTKQLLTARTVTAAAGS